MPTDERLRYRGKISIYPVLPNLDVQTTLE